MGQAHNWSPVRRQRDPGPVLTEALMSRVVDVETADDHAARRPNATWASALTVWSLRFLATRR